MKCQGLIIDQLAVGLSPRRSEERGWGEGSPEATVEAPPLSGSHRGPTALTDRRLTPPVEPASVEEARPVVERKSRSPVVWIRVRAIEIRRRRAPVSLARWTPARRSLRLRLVVGVRVHVEERLRGARRRNADRLLDAEGQHGFGIDHRW